jgi:hypothetical protein
VLHFDDGANHANGDNASIPPTPSLPDFLPTSASMSKSISAPEMSSAAADPPAATNGDSLQPPKLVRTRSRSFSRRKTLANLELDLPTPSTAALQRSLPFAVIAPEVLPGQVFDAMPLTRTYVGVSLLVQAELKDDLAVGQDRRALARAFGSSAGAVVNPFGLHEGASVCS